VHAGDARVIELGGTGRIAGEAGAEAGLGADVGGQLLQRHAAQQAQIERLEDGDVAGAIHDATEPVVIDDLVDLETTARGRHARSMPRRATMAVVADNQVVLGIDIGGSGLKGAPVDVATGELTAERLRIETPKPSTPAAVAKVVATIAQHFAW